MTNKKDALLKRCLKLYVPALSDAADEVGIGVVCMDTALKPVTKLTRMAGFARTGKLLRSPPNKPYDETQLDEFISLVTKAKKNDIIAINMSGATDCSGWGQILTKSGLPLGIRGTVIDGTTRDVEAIDMMGYPVFARGRHPGTMRGRMDMEFIDEPMSCGGVTVHPGDLIFGDGDGVVVIPIDRVEEVLAGAEEVVDTDNWWEEKLEEGKDPHDLHKEKPIP
jgi:regulator of RNase E activity RraA